jgi:ATP-dependent DNA ligase
VRSGDHARIWSRQRRDLTDRFPDLAAAAVRQLADGVVLDGELVILVDGRLSFDALQRRLVTSPAKARQLVTAVPAGHMAFDLLTIGIDLRTQRWTTRRRRLEQLAKTWTPPLQISPVTDDLAEAQEWYDVLPAAMGIEGLVVKGAATRYAGGRREWLKVNSVGVESVWAATRELVVRGQAGVWVLPAVRDRWRGRVVGGLVVELGRGSRGLVESKAGTLSSSTAGRARRHGGSAMSRYGTGPRPASC